MTISPFDILKVGDDGKTQFLEAALTLDAAMARAQALAARRAWRISNLQPRYGNHLSR